MKKQPTIEVLAIRVDGKVVDFEGINDCYTNIQVCISKDYNLDETALKKLRDDRFTSEYDDSFNLGEAEAGDMTFTSGNLSVMIESFPILIN
jgi:hypothetical protein